METLKSHFLHPNTIKAVVSVARLTAQSTPGVAQRNNAGTQINTLSPAVLDSPYVSALVRFTKQMLKKVEHVRNGGRRYIWVPNLNIQPSV